MAISPPSPGGTSPASPRRFFRSLRQRRRGHCARRGVVWGIPRRVRHGLDVRDASQTWPACGHRRRGRHALGRRVAAPAEGEPGGLHLVLPPAQRGGPRRRRPRGLFIDLAGFDEWMSRWRALGPDPESMDRVNPIYIPRNHLVEEALTEATAGDLDPLQRLLVAVTAPYDERAGFERYASPAPEDFGTYRTFCGT